MELRHLRYFVAVAEELNFRRAAEKLRVAQPALSMQIKDLEEELKIQLFERSTHSVSLTDAGKVFLQDARHILATTRLAVDKAQKAQRGLVGSLKMGMMVAVASPWIADAVRNYRSRFPGVDLSLFDLTSPEQLARLRSGDLDVGLLRPPVLFPDLDFRLVEESRHVLATSFGHPLSKKKQLQWKDFDGENLVMLQPTLQHGYYDAFLAACAKAGAKPQVAQYATGIHAKLWLVAAGFGVAATTATISVHAERLGLVLRELPPGLPPVQMILAWRKNDDSTALANFINFFKPVENQSNHETVG